MSIPFTKLTGADRAKAGYCRIGNVVLSLPPTDILTNRVSGKERITTLRGSNDLVKLTGQGRWDVTIRFLLMQDDTAGNDKGKYAQWEDLRTIVAMFKAAPFVEVENSYIRQVLCEQDPTLESKRTAFGLRQLRVAIHPDIVDALDCSLTMTLFNFAPYTDDFGYQGSSGQAVDADRSSIFGTYLTTWKAQNLDATKDPTYDGAFLADWKDQNPGTVTFNWREYHTLKINTAVVSEVSPASANAITDALQKTTGLQQNPGITGTPSQIGMAAVAIAQAVSKKINVSPDIIFAQWAHETGNFTNRGATQLNNLAGINVPGGHGQDYRSWPTLTDYGNYYASLVTRRYKSCVGANTIPQYAAGLKAGGWYTANEAAYSAAMVRFQNSYYAYSALASKTPVQSQAVQANKAAAAQPAVATAAATATPKAPVSPLQVLVSSLAGADQTQVLLAIANGWELDHATNDLVYFYVTHSLSFADEEHGGSTLGMFPQQLSILMVNNLAQIPLASYIYPTYQHIGSPSSQIAIGFISVGTRKSEEDEPVHPGISMLGGIISFLENQYLLYRNNWRQVGSVHRMQAVYVENQILNMLGIRGLMLDNLSSETIPSSADESQVELAATQYENTFETLLPFKIRTISDTASKVTQSIIIKHQLAKLNTQEQAGIPLLNTYSNGRQNSDMDTLCTLILGQGKPNTDVFGSFDNTPSMTPSAAQIADMIALITPPTNVQQPTQSASSQISTMSSSMTGGYVPVQAAATSATNIQQYPAIVRQLTSAQSSGNWTAGDLMLARALATDPSQTSGQSYISPAMQNTVKATDTLLLDEQVDTAAIQAVYDAMFPILAGNNTVFAAEVNALTTSPTFSNQYTAAFDAAGPALSKDNNDGRHVSYRDMGLTTTMSPMGVDNNPANYFVDHSAERSVEFKKQVDAVIQGSAQTSQGTNTTPGMNTASNEQEFYQSITDSDFVGQNVNTNSVMQMANLPGLTMAEAFPTFKLFLMEDESGGIINCFDNFYSYASVTEMEVIRYRDQPDVAVIQITNISNLLMHHLFDDTLMGRYEYSLNPFQNALPSGAGQVAGQEGGTLIAGKTAAGQPYQVDRSDGVIDGKRERIPLQYVAMQPGTKIQIRMGYTNNPDLLTPVFTGRVTQITSEKDMLVITAESYVGELCLVPVLDGYDPGTDKDFGQEWTKSDGGDVISVVEWLLSTQTAKHFGMFKLATPLSDPLISGLTWQNRIGRSVGEFSVDGTNKLTQIGAALASSYDRSGENILVNHLINNMGNPSKIRKGSDIAPSSFIDTGGVESWLLLKFDYHIKKNSTFTTWELIRDVCRRYPAFNVAAKQYGFPYSADATLVVAHPLASYFARPPLLGDVETYRTAPQLTNEWNDWWNGTGNDTGNVSGKDLWATMISNIATILSDTKGFVSANMGTPTDPTSMENLLQLFSQTLYSFTGMNSGQVNPDSFHSALYGVDVLLEDLSSKLWGGVDLLTDQGNYAANRKSKMAAVVAEEVAVRSAWYTYVQQQNQLNGTTSNDRLQPVRRYHLIDYNSIIHNGMTINDKIYNGVQVAEDTVLANGNIPTHHRRILDVTSLTNYPEKNLNTSAIRNAVGQSYLRDEVGKMYRGEIVLRGVPKIEPYDCLILLDPSTAIAGVVEVDKVIQSFSLETGYITIVYPRCLVAINEVASAGAVRMLSMVMAKTWYNVSGVANGGLANAWNSMDGKEKAIGLAGAAGAAGLTVGLVAMASPPGWLVAVGASALAFYGVLVTGYKNQKANEIQVLPVSRYGRPWIGGLEGYKITDFWGNVASSFKEFEVDNIYPGIELWRYAKGVSNNVLPYNALPVQPPGQ